MRSLVLVAALLLGSLFRVQAQAATYNVYPDGSGDFATIQEAITASVDGGVIQLGDGVFTGLGNRDLDTDEIRLTLVSMSGDPLLCVIDCQGSQSEPHFGIAYSALGFDTILRGITVRNGYSATDGGALRMNDASITVENCIFEDNYAYRHGGAVSAMEWSSPSFTDCVFQNNTADYYGEGGAIYAHQESSVNIVRCTFAGNQASYGGALYFEMECLPTVSSSTFHNNTQSTIRLVADCFLDMNHSIVAFGNEVITSTGSNQALLSCCDVYGNSGGNWVGLLAGQLGVSGNIEANPSFCHSVTGVLTLLSNSPCAPDYNPGCGLIGSQPVGCEASIIVNAAGTGDYANIQAAIYAAISGVDMIGLEDGNYMGVGNYDIDFLGKAITIRSLSDNPEACLINASGSENYPRRCFVFQNGEGIDTVLKGLTLMNGWHQYGGGIYLQSGAAPLIENCHFKNNTASSEAGLGYGGGVFVLYGANPTFVNCDFYENSFGPTGSGSGGAIFCGSDNGFTALDCRFWKNGTSLGLEIGGVGGAISAENSGDITISNCQLFQNRASNGGAIFFFSSFAQANLDIAGSTFYGNQGRINIINLLGELNTVNLTNTIIVNNEAECWLQSEALLDVTIQCSNIFGNTGGDWPDVIADQAGTAGNLSIDPKFCDAAAGDLNLEATSPCLPGSEANPSCGLMGALGQGCDYRGLISSVADVPNDQGRRVRVSWNRSSMDSYGTLYAITNYSIWRRIDDPGAKAIVPPADKSNPADKFPSGDWDYVTSVPALGEYQYNALCETVADSTISGGQHWSTFFVSAETDEPTMSFYSLTAAGYSIDNLAPAAPENLRLESPTRLAWDEISAADFDYYTVYGSFSGVLDGAEEMLGQTISLALDIPETSYPFYLLTATDFSGNEGQAAILITGVSSVDNELNLTRFALYQAWPNPGTQGTNFSFDLPKASMVNLSVYDLAGRRVSTVVSSVLPAGSHSVAWTGRVDGSSGPLASGVYFYRIKAGEFSDSGRVMILK